MQGGYILMLVQMCPYYFYLYDINNNLLLARYYYIPMPTCADILWAEVMGQLSL